MPIFADPGPISTILGFWDFGFLYPGILALGFLSFRGPGSGFKSNYEPNQPSGGSFFSKMTPPWISKARGVRISPQKGKSSYACLEVWKAEVTFRI